MKVHGKANNLNSCRLRVTGPLDTRSIRYACREIWVRPQLCPVKQQCHCLLNKHGKQHTRYIVTIYVQHCCTCDIWPLAARKAGLSRKTKQQATANHQQRWFQPSQGYLNVQCHHGQKHQRNAAYAVRTLPCNLSNLPGGPPDTAY